MKRRRSSAAAGRSYQEFSEGENVELLDEWERLLFGKSLRLSAADV